MGSGVLAKLSGAVTTKTAAVVAAGTLAVAGAAGAGVWYVNQGPQLAVVQRSTSVSVPAGGQQTAVVGCQAHETALGGGYAIAGTGFATNSHFIGGAWLAAAVNPGDAPATLTAYALCVNAKVELKPGLDFTFKAHAFKDRTSDKIINTRDGEETHDLTTAGPYAAAVHTPEAHPYCDGPGYIAVGTEFRAGRIVQGHAAAPVPLDQLTSDSALPGVETPLPWRVSVNPGTELSSRSFLMHDSEARERQTRIEDPQPTQANYAVDARPICAMLPSTSTATVKVTVPAGASADAAVSCPKGQFVVGGGFAFRPDATAQRYNGDGWLFASADAPAAGEPSGRKVRQWHVTGINQEKPGSLYHDSVWVEHSDPETLTGNGYLDSHAHGADDQMLRPAAVPAGEPMIASAICATIDAKPTEPAQGAKPPVLNRPDQPPVDILTSPSGSAAASSPAPSGSPTPGQSASPSASPSSHSPNSPGTPASPGPNQSSTPPRSSPSAQPQSPTVSINEPAGGATLRRGCEESFAGTARTRPGGQSLTDPQYTTWQLKGPGGPVTLGAGASGRFLIPLLPDGTYPLVFTATDPAGGQTGSAQISVRIVGCLR